MINKICQYLAIFSALTMLFSGIWMALGDSDHPNALPGIIFVTSIIFLFISMVMVASGTGKNFDYWPDRAQDIAGRYQGKLSFMGKILDKESYSIEFIYQGVKFEYFDTYTLSTYKSPAISATQKDLLFRTSVPTNFTLDMAKSTGESMIGKTVDQVDGFFKLGLKEISQNPSLVVYHGLKIYSDQEKNTLNFLLDPDVQRIYLKYKQADSGTYISFPLRIKDGYVSFIFVDADRAINQGLKRSDDLNLYLDDLVLLSRKLNT